MKERSKFRIRVLARFLERLRGNEGHLTFSLLSGKDWDHLTLCGTMSMSEREFDDLVDALRAALGDDFDIEILEPAHS